MPKTPLTRIQLEQKLKRFYSTRKAADSTYTYRAMANELDVQFASLYRVLTGSRRLGLHLARALAPKFDVELVERHKSSRKKKTTGPFELARLNPFSETHIHWLSLAILESTKMKDFTPSTSWVAKRFGINEADVTQTLDRMENEGLLKRTSDGWRDLLQDAAIFDRPDKSGLLIRNIIRGLMAVSTDAVEQIPMDERKHAFAIFPVAKKQLPRLQKRLTVLQREFGAYASQSRAPKDSVYALQLGFFPLTKGTSPT